MENPFEEIIKRLARIESLLTKYKNGKRLFFLKSEIDEWIKKGRGVTNEDIDRLASNYLIKNKFKF